MSTPSIANQQLEVLEKNEVYEDSDSGFHFAATLVVYQLNGHLYHAKLKSRHSSSSKVNAEDLENITRILSLHTIQNFRPSFRQLLRRYLLAHISKKPSLIN